MAYTLLLIVSNKLFHHLLDIIFKITLVHAFDRIINLNYL